DTPNEDYILKEKGAVLNWFDITEVEGYYSLNDTMGDIMKAPLGQQLFAGMMANMGKSKDGMASMINFDDPDTMKGMMQMMGGFTVLRLIGMLGMTGLKMNKEQLLDLNAKLNKIKKA
ncbi:MAG: glycoside hydrolase family 2 protein, partial [Clostridia bacterium]|nr:glycoside hydrolase family 2 protein [Clostridia bacterium]